MVTWDLNKAFQVYEDLKSLENNGYRVSNQLPEWIHELREPGRHIFQIITIAQNLCLDTFYNELKGIK